MKSGPSENIVVFRIGQLGDALVSVPAVSLIRQAHAGASLFLLTNRHPGTGFVSSWEVFEPTGWFADVLDYIPGGSARALVKLLSRIRAIAPKRLYYLAPVPRRKLRILRDRLFFRVLCGIRETPGLTTPAPSRSLEGGTLPRLERESERLVRLVREAIPSTATESANGIGMLEPSARHRVAPRRVLESAGFLGHPLVAVGPGSKMQAKRWPEERYATLGSRIIEKLSGVRLVVVGGREEGELGRRLCQQWGARSLNTAGELSVWEAAALLQDSALYVGNDTGTMHLAASVGTPCVAIFSARDHPGRWEPLGGGHLIHRKEVECHGCMLETCIDRDLACLRAVTVEEVLESVIRLMDHRGDA